MASDYDFLRKEMVEIQLVPRGIKDPRVLEAFLKVPRHQFVPENIRALAYEDNALPVGSGQTISQPYMVAVMTELLRLQGNEKVLEIGTGSGYQAAILAELCQKVYTLERIESLSQKAKEVINQLGYKNIEFIFGDGTQGHSQAAPFDGIIVTAGCPAVPQPLVDQLSDGGRLVVPVGERFQQVLTVVSRWGGRISTEESIGCIFVPLIGKYGWSD